jgi:hypothetical protein
MHSSSVGDIQPIIEWLIIEGHPEAIGAVWSEAFMSLVHDTMRVTMRYAGKEYAIGKAICVHDEEYLRNCGLIQNGQMPEYARRYFAELRGCS